MDITISINTDDVADKLKEIRKEPVKVVHKNDNRTNEMLGLLKKRLDRQSEPVGGSV
jgi:hypothetical protein